MRLPRHLLLSPSFVQYSHGEFYVRNPTILSANDIAKNFYCWHKTCNYNMWLLEAGTWQDVLGVQQELVLLTVSINLIVGTGWSTKGFIIQLHLFCGPPNHSKELKRMVNVKSAIPLQKKKMIENKGWGAILVWFGTDDLVCFGLI